MRQSSIALLLYGAGFLLGQSSPHAAENFDQWTNNSNMCLSWVRLNEGGHASPQERISACSRIIDAGSTPSDILNKYPDFRRANFKFIGEGQTYMGRYYVGRGDAYLAINRPKDALADFDHVQIAALSDTWTPEFYASRALANDFLGNYDLVLSDVDHADQNTTPAHRPWYNTKTLRADAELQLGRYTEAVSHYEQVIQNSRRFH